MLVDREQTWMLQPTSWMLLHSTTPIQLLTADGMCGKLETHTSTQAASLAQRFQAKTSIHLVPVVPHQLDVYLNCQYYQRSGQEQQQSQSSKSTDHLITCSQMDGAEGELLLLLLDAGLLGAQATCNLAADLFVQQVRVEAALPTLLLPLAH